MSAAAVKHCLLAVIISHCFPLRLNCIKLWLLECVWPFCSRKFRAVHRYSSCFRPTPRGNCAHFNIYLFRSATIFTPSPLHKHCSRSFIYFYFKTVLVHDDDSLSCIIMLYVLYNCVRILLINIYDLFLFFILFQ